MTNRTARTRAEAKKLMWEYYRDNKQLLPKNIYLKRETLISNIRFGMAVRPAFDQAIKSVSKL